VSVPAAPWVTWSVAGRRLVSVGPLGETVTALWTALPFRLAVMVAVPGATATTGTGTKTAPAGTVTTVGTEATAGALLWRLMLVGMAWTALMVAVRVPVPPWVMGRAAGSRVVRVGGGTLPYRVRRSQEPGRLARVTWRVLRAWRLTGRSKEGPSQRKSKSPAT